MELVKLLTLYIKVMLSQKQPKSCLPLVHRNPTATLITNLWTKSAVDMHQSLSPCTLSSASCSSVPGSMQLETSLAQNEEKITISKQELLEFTKKFAMSKIDFEEQIETLKAQLDSKLKMIAVLEDQNKELRVQENYLIKVMEELRDKHILEIQGLNAKYQNGIKMKEVQVDYLGDELKKIRMWLEEQKMEARRCMGFLKIKDQIIENLDWEIIRLKGELKDVKDSRESLLHNQHNNILAVTSKLNENGQLRKTRSSSTKKIILRKDRKEDKENKGNKESKENKGNKESKENKQKDSKCIQQLTSETEKNDGIPSLQYEDMLQLTSMINGLRIQKIEIENQKFEVITKNRQLYQENENLKKQLQKLERQKSHNESGKIRKSIDDLNEISKKIKDSQADKENMLITKCLFLERHVDKLSRELSRIKNQNLVLQYSKDQSEDNPGKMEMSMHILSEVL